MGRLACINLPRIDLQIVALRHPEWKRLPAVVVTEERPLGRITAANRAARAAGVEPGMRYAAGLSICGTLRAGVVDPPERSALREKLVALLGTFSPHVEPAADDPALFWINAGGLDRIYDSQALWAESIQAAIEREELVCSIAVGFSRFGTYAAAKVKRRITVFQREDEERAAALRAPIGVLPIDHEVLLRCRQLGIDTIQDFCRFSPGSLRRRFGPEIERLQRFAKDEESLPLQSVDTDPVLRREMRLLYPEGSVETLLQHQLSLLRELIAEAWAQQRLIGELALEFHPERWPGSEDERFREHILTTTPTRDRKMLERLIRLRLESLRLSGPVVRLSLEVTFVPTDRAQEDLFVDTARRDPRKALAAIGELCAELGNDAVQIAGIESSHMPQERYRWRRVERLLPAKHPRDDPEDLPARSPLVRRIFHEPYQIAGISDQRHDSGCFGPYELSGGWWHGSYRREYYYLRDPSGRVLWVYRNLAPEGTGAAGRWFVQGIVE